MKGLYRSDTDRVVGGVCSGLAQYLRVDALFVRIAFVVLGMIQGIGVILYLAAWVLLPEKGIEDYDQERIMRENVQEIRERARELGEEARDRLGGRWNAGQPGSAGSSGNMLLIGIVLVSFGLLVLLSNFGLLAWIGRLWPLALVAVGVVVLVRNLKAGN